DAAAGSDGIVSIVFSREDPVGLVYLEDDFSAKTDGDTGGTFALGNSGTRCSVARNGSDVYISYFDVADASLKVAHSIPGGWDVQTIDNSEGAGFFNAIAIPAYNESPVVVFARSGGTKGLFFATCDGEMWNTETIVPQFAGFFCSIALDKGGVPFVAYQSLDAPGASSLHCIRYNGEGWLDELVDNQGDTGYYTSIVLDSAGYAHISYSDRVNLLYAKQTATGWEKSILVQGGVDGSTDITLISGKPAIAFIHSGKPGYIDATGTATDGGDGDGGGTVTPTSGGGGGCFIATAAFGTMASDAVGRLTNSRDETVTASESGIQLVNLYYAVSPAAAVALAKSESARKLMALLLP
ncbi:MAG: CFI-box-CTERM domain-containing protein, partial [Candidatus Brocadiia bacterium]